MPNPEDPIGELMRTLPELGGGGSHWVDLLWWMR
jgi:hypothetical protein